MTEAVGGGAGFPFRGDGSARLGPVGASGFAFECRRHFVRFRQEDSRGTETGWVSAAGSSWED